MCVIWETRGQFPRRVIPKTQKMVHGTALLNTQLYTVRIKGKVEQSREWSSTLPYTFVWYWKGNLWVIFDLRYIYIYIYICLRKRVCACMYLPNQFLCYWRDMTYGQFSSRVQLAWIQSFPSPRLAALPKLKNPICPSYSLLDGGEQRHSLHQLHLYRGVRLL